MQRSCNGELWLRIRNKARLWPGFGSAWPGIFVREDNFQCYCFDIQRAVFVTCLSILLTHAYKLSNYSFCQLFVVAIELLGSCLIWFIDDVMRLISSKFNAMVAHSLSL